MTRTVADTAIMLQVIAGVDANDHHSVDVPVPDYLAGLQGGVRGLRVGVPRELVDAQRISPKHRERFEANLRRLERLGATVEDVSMPGLLASNPVLRALMGGETTAYHLPWCVAGWPITARTCATGSCSAPSSRAASTCRRSDSGPA